MATPGHRLDRAVREHPAYPVVAGISDVQSAIGADGHTAVGVKRQARIDRRSAVTGEAVSPVTGDDRKLAVWEPLQHFIPTRVDNVKASVRSRCERFGFFRSDRWAG